MRNRKYRFSKIILISYNYYNFKFATYDRKIEEKILHKLILCTLLHLNSKKSYIIKLFSFKLLTTKKYIYINVIYISNSYSLMRSCEKYVLHLFLFLYDIIFSGQ